MNLGRFRLLAGALLASGAALTATAAEPEPPPPKSGIEAGPALGWVLPIFTDREGYHLYTLRGSSARPIGSDRIEVADFNAIVFSGDATQRVDTVLLSPKATFFPQENRAEGDGPVRLIHDGDNIEVTAVGWSYDQAARKVSLGRHVRVRFRAQLNDILK